MELSLHQAFQDPVLWTLLHCRVYSALLNVNPLNTDVLSPFDLGDSHGHVVWWLPGGQEVKTCLLWFLCPVPIAAQLSPWVGSIMEP